MINAGLFTHMTGLVILPLDRPSKSRQGMKFIKMRTSYAG
jgi:hypothetical protein